MKTVKCKIQNSKRKMTNISRNAAKTATIAPFKHFFAPLRRGVIFFLVLSCSCLPAGRFVDYKFS